MILPRYSIIDIGTLGGDDRFRHASGVRAHGLNNRGLVVGASCAGEDGVRAFLYRHRDDGGGAMTGLALPRGCHSGGARAVSDAGRIVGNLFVATGYAHAFLCDARAPDSGEGVGAPRDLGTLGGSHSRAYDVNRAGWIVGCSSLVGNKVVRAFLHRDGGFVDLGTLGGRTSHAYGINAAGRIVGYAMTGGGARRAFLHDGSRMHDLGTLGGDESTAWDINDAGLIIGMSRTVAGSRHAFLHDGERMHDLGTLGDRDATALRVNAAGQVVGYACAFRGKEEDSRALLWRGGTPTDLNDLLPSGSGWTLTQATGINDAGWIVGWGRIAGRARVFLLIPAGAPSAAGAPTPQLPDDRL